MLTSIWRSLQSWNRDRGVALLAAAALAIGIASAAAIFTVVDNVLLKPLPYSDGERWVALLAGDTHNPDHYAGLSYVDCLAYKDGLKSFEELGWYPVAGDFNLTSPGQPRHVEGIPVSASIIAHTGAVPAVGRFFNPSDGSDVAVISNRLYKQLGSTIIGKAITLNGRAYTVVGVTPSWFRLPIVSVYSRNSENDVWVPLTPPQDPNQAKNYAIYSIYAKLKPGIPIGQAKAEAKRVAAQIQRTNHSTDPTYTIGFLSLQDTVSKNIRPMLLLLLGASGLLLSITCANVAGLLVSRSVGRARETAIRVALGGGRRQLGLQYFFESLWISLAALVGGMLLSVAFVRAILLLSADYIPRYDEIQVSWRGLFFALLLALFTATLSSLAPLWQAVRTLPNEVLSNGVRASAGLRSRRLSRYLVIGEIALAFTLISTGSLLLWNFWILNQTSPGFEPNGLITFQLTRPNEQWMKQSGNHQSSSGFVERLIDTVEAIPGVNAAAMANQVPLTGCCFSTSLFPQPGLDIREIHEPVSKMTVSASYFKTMRIPLLAGRLLNNRDTDEDLLPIVIDEAAAQLYWPGKNALGALAHLGSENGNKVHVVGIVQTIQNNGIGKKPMPEIYIVQEADPQQQLNFLVRSTLSPAGLTAAIRRAVALIDPEQPIYAVLEMTRTVRDSLIFQRIEWIVVIFFAIAALLMACLGVYGLTSYSVRQRTTEIGTRMALGSTGSQITQLVTSDSLRLALYGIAVGAVGAISAGALVSRYLDLHEVSALPYVVSIAIILLVALLSAFVPGWRASLLSPMLAIRNDSESIWTSAKLNFQMARQQLLPTSKPAAFDSNLLTEFIEASRKADSFAGAFHTALEDLRSKLHARSALLLEKAADGRYICIAATPEGTLSDVSLAGDGFLLNRLTFYSSPMSFSVSDLSACLRWAEEKKRAHLPELQTLEHIPLRLAAALRTNKEVIGLLLFSEGDVPYTPAEKSLVGACAEQFALTIENSRLNGRILEQEKVRRDIALATEVQKRLLPESSPEMLDTSLGAFTLAARSVGGDYYDFLQIGERVVGIALADIAGKGIAAALIMAVVQASLRIIAADENSSLPEQVGKLSRVLHRSTGFNSYATFFYAQWDEQVRQLRYVNAGHNPPFLLRAALENAAESKRTIEELTTGGMIIGMFPGASYQEATLQLSAGDLLLAFTDGVTEAMSPTGEEFGEDRLKATVTKLAHLPVQDLTSAITQELRDWMGNAEQHDDITFVLMKVSNNS